MAIRGPPQKRQMRSMITNWPILTGFVCASIRPDPAGRGGGGAGSGGTAPADDVAMNAMMFGSKRAFHGCLRVMRRRLQAHGLTAARFDMLSAILRDPSCSCPQRELRDLLGVSSPVISRMLRSLERLGLVVRERVDDGDRRQKWIKLTAAGRERIQKARKELIPEAMRLVRKAISFGKLDDAFLHMCNLEDYLRGMRTEFGDRASLSYPWHPDD